MRISVLVAEDDAVTRRGLIELLQEEGFIAFGAADGMAAWDQFQQRKPDFVCLDVMMPGLSGYEVCKKIRVSSDVPILFITAKGEEIDKVVGLELGADDYIVKPFGMKEVIARMRAIARRCLQNRPGNNDSDLPNADFVMDDVTVSPHQLRARRDDQQIDLSLREVKILAALFRNQGEVVDRQKLMSLAWNQEYFPSSRTLDQHISQLRKRIERDPKHPEIIQTVHGVGYRYQPSASKS